jgi:ABC-type lipoprotein release transport system permease subunit
MLIFRLATKNLLGAGLRTWLNGFVLSISFLAIITTQALLKGMYQQTTSSMIDAEIAGGQYWHPNYDPYDPLTLQNSHGIIPETLKSKIQSGDATGILIIQGTIYPNGRIRPVLLKGIDPHQEIVNLPSSFLAKDFEDIPVIIGKRMAKAIGLHKGDHFTVQWRDANETFDARDAVIMQVMKTSVQSIDVNQIWIPLERLQEMAGMEDETTIVICARNTECNALAGNWIFRSQEYLLSDVTEMVKAKSFGSMFIYMLLLFLAMLAIFDTQIFSIFRRKKEIGTLMALGLTRGRVIKLFTLEGSMQAAFGAFIGALYGIPLLSLFARNGWTLLESTDSYGFALGEKLYPVFTIGIIIGTSILIFLATTIVSYLPTRKIAKLKPTEALRGRLI